MRKNKKNEKKQEINTNVFDTKTKEIGKFTDKNQIILDIFGRKRKPFVKMTKIGIEIRKPFVYNVFVAASKPKAA